MFGILIEKNIMCSRIKAFTRINELYCCSHGCHFEHYILLSLFSRSQR